MKKLFALLLALALTAAMMTSAMAYTEVTFPANAQITHTLELTEADMSTLPYDITYSFKNEGAVEVVSSGITNTGLAVTGSPTIAPVVYFANSQPDDVTNKSYTKVLVINWDDVKITEPGVYRWKFSKTVSSADPVQSNLSNNTSELYLYAYVTINGTELTASVVLTDIAAVKDNDLEDAYPAKTLSLSLSKVVTGNQGSRNQYFEYTVSLTSPSGASPMRYPINYANATKTASATAYNGEITNPDAVSVPVGGTAGTVTVWLKDGETITIDGLLFGTSYTIVETVPAGYAAKAEITSGDTQATINGAEVADGNLTIANTAVKYTNHKEATVPTGIELHSGAPVMGILLAMGLMIVLFIGKRKEEMA